MTGGGAAGVEVYEAGAAGARVRVRLDGRRAARDDGLLAAGGHLLWADVVESAEHDARVVAVVPGEARRAETPGEAASLPALTTSLQAGPALLARSVAALPERPGVVLWYEHAGGPQVVLRVRVLLSGRPLGALAFANEGARLAPVLREDGGLRFRLYPGTPPLTFHAAGAVFVERPAWRGAGYGDGEEDLPSPGFFFTILRRPGAIARIVALADDGAAPALLAAGARP